MQYLYTSQHSGAVQEFRSSPTFHSAVPNLDKIYRPFFSVPYESQSLRVTPVIPQPTAPFPHHTRTGARAVLVTSLGALRAFDIDIFLAVSVPPEIPP